MKFLPKSLGGVKGFRKNCQGGSTYFAFYCIFINKFFKNLPGGCCFIPPLPLTPLCASMISIYNNRLAWHNILLCPLKPAWTQNLLLSCEYPFCSILHCFLINRVSENKSFSIEFKYLCPNQKKKGGSTASLYWNCLYQ